MSLSVFVVFSEYMNFKKIFSLKMLGFPKKSFLIIKIPDYTPNQKKVQLMRIGA